MSEHETLWASQDETRERFLAATPDCPHCGVNPCYSLCPNSPNYYSPEQEREDALWNESLSQGEYMSLAMIEFEQGHGEPYVS